jgi:predicted MFS family arabinose efflux permease
MATTAAVSLTLEQVPGYAGTMMSLNAVAVNIGSAVGSGIGGLALISFGYKGLGNILGSLGVLGAFIYYFLTKDILPIKILTLLYFEICKKIFFNKIKLQWKK